ncbi:hypothetical protein CS006_06505 [Bifidobacterium primatium]|uniref:NADPH-dependent FMN reductase-like domain-containing protein n=1 Tax=Bifidobacterium primatium TaxID=2045438 RepID=A0A2M9H7Y4_9BIFI|nr:hypothetical protein CS006_06505 [Bifidobacterium primatium]
MSDSPTTYIAIHTADAIIVISPVYYNNLEARLITAIDRMTRYLDGQTERTNDHDQRP